MSEWQTMDSAPKDGADIDLWVDYIGAMQLRMTNCQFRKPALYRMGAKNPQEPCWCQEDFTSGWQPIVGTPTHWMPLPPPPETTP